MNVLTALHKNNRSHQVIANQVANVCLTHQNRNKWILLIADEDETISAISNQSEVDTSKILRINQRKVKVKAENLEVALAKGNCSAVVLTKNDFESEQIAHLRQCAKLSNTEFVVCGGNSQLH